MLSAAQLAVRVHVPVPLVIVTRLPVIEQTPAAVRLGVVLAFVVAESVNCDLYTAVTGAPVNVTVGIALLTTTGDGAVPDATV